MSALLLKQVEIRKAGASAPLVQLEQLQVEPGQVATIMGPSGSGKSTLLRWVLGEPLPAFECRGELWFSGAAAATEPTTTPRAAQALHKLPIHQRQIGLMYQQGELFPHLTVLENLCFALPRKGVWFASKPDPSEAFAALEQLGLAAKAHAVPQSLSGGERSRVALIRSLLARPRALLLDEPFSALDTELREQIRAWTFAQIAERQIPAILVTHDPADQGNGALVQLAKAQLAKAQSLSPDSR